MLLTRSICIRLTLGVVLVGPILQMEWQELGGLVQDCSISLANALEMLQSCTEHSTYVDFPMFDVNMYSDCHTMSNRWMNAEFQCLTRLDDLDRPDDTHANCM